MPMYRFTIRDVLWLMVAVGLACGWWIEHSRRESQIKDRWNRYAIEQAYNQEARKRLTNRITVLENAIASAGAQIPLEPKGMTFQEFLTALESLERAAPRK